MNEIKISPAVKVYSTGGVPVAASGEIRVVHVDEANSNGELVAGNAPVASSAFVNEQVVVDMSMTCAATERSCEKRGLDCRFTLAASDRSRLLAAYRAIKKCQEKNRLAAVSLSMPSFKEG